MSDVYATRRDLYRYGLPRGTLVMQARLVASSTASSDIIELDGHGFETDDEILFRAAEGGTLSAPLVVGTTYYAIRISDSSFKVAAAPAGAAINLTTDGSEMIVAAPLPVDEVLEYYSRFVDDFAPAHAVPLTAPYPVVVVATVAELSAKKLLSLSGQQSINVDAAEASAKEVLERWAKGIPMRDAAATTAHTNKAVSSVVSSTNTDPRGWGSSELP